MLDESFKDVIKNSFIKVKGDIDAVGSEIKLQKELIIVQTEVLKELKKRIDFLESQFKEVKNTLKPSSSGNDKVNQSINHLINQSITNQSFDQSINHFASESQAITGGISNNEANQSFDQSITNQSLINQSQNMDFSQLKKQLEGVFKSLSKQELKLFLTIYQIEDDNLEANYKTIAANMQLSEHCIRGHISSLMKKNVPITKKRLNNRTNLLSIKHDFRALNLKSRLIHIFYDSDPNQTTLFDIKKQ